MQDRMTIHQLTGKLVAELKRNGFSETTIWRCYMPCVGSIEHYYEKLGQILYDPAVTSEFVQFQKDRVKAGEIKNDRPYLLAAERLNEVYMTGIRWLICYAVFSLSSCLDCFKLQSLHEPAILLRRQLTYFLFTPWPLIYALFQSFVKQDEPVFFPIQPFHLVPPPSAEQKQRIGEWIQTELLPHQKDGIFAMDYAKGVQKRVEFYHDGFKQKAPLVMAEVDQLPRPVTFYNYRPSELIVRMLRGICEFCGNHENIVKVHHVAALKDLNPEKPWEAKMLSMRRKSLVVCGHCFALIQSDM